jgi:hypothetical protein
MKYIDSGAAFSPDRKYRYDLWRVWRENGRRINFVGLNPSTASEYEDDPTIRREVAFADAWGYGEMHKLNLFAFCSSDPRSLCWPNPDPVGPKNTAYLISLYPEIVVDWGSWGKLHIGIEARGETVLHLLRKPLYCFGRNKDGSPKHPLYLPSTSKLEEWDIVR